MQSFDYWLDINLNEILSYLASVINGIISHIQRLFPSQRGEGAVVPLGYKPVSSIYVSVISIRFKTLDKVL